MRGSFFKMSRRTDRSLDWTSPPSIPRWPDLLVRTPPSGEQIRQVWGLTTRAHAAPPGRPQLQLQWWKGNPSLLIILFLDSYILNFYRMEKGSQVFSCEECFKQFKYYQSLTRHKQVQHEGIRFPCDLCQAQFTREEGVARHKEYQHKKV